jgi:hypothetical protein
MKTNIKALILALVLILSAQLVVGSVLAGAAFHGNTSSKVFHSPDCRYYNCAKCTSRFDSREAATRAGYRPCKVCKP